MWGCLLAVGEAGGCGGKSAGCGEIFTGCGGQSECWVLGILQGMGGGLQAVGVPVG